VKRFMGFKRMLAAAKSKNWKKMSDEGMDSLWSRQVGKRANELMNVVRNTKK